MDYETNVGNIRRIQDIYSSNPLLQTISAAIGNPSLIPKGEEHRNLGRLFYHLRRRGLDIAVYSHEDLMSVVSDPNDFATHFTSIDRKVAMISDTLLRPENIQRALKELRHTYGHSLLVDDFKGNENIPSVWVVPEMFPNGPVIHATHYLDEAQSYNEAA